MFLIFAICALSRVHYHDEPRYDANGLGKAFKKITHVVTRPVKKVFHVATKVTSVVTKPVVRLIHHSSTSEWESPCQITSFTTNTGSNDWVVDNLDDAVNDVASQFSLNADSVRNYFNRCKWSQNSKQLFNNLNFDKLADVNQRSALRAATVIKVSKDGSNFNINVRQISTLANIYASTVRKDHSRTLVFSSSSTHASWRPLEANELQDIFNACEEEIAPTLNQYKAI
ncbi:hypothetical protein TVAG_053280 [Trichomonas vaginalis G3]|uniref:Uncharacterized protein n=1 Tax=Trichomonas vaginalis (strain ATCC PRA-98 / G3) TaxID=412133 RepID=A2EMT1_TRIV3|nr:hypothetical protein TVAGG3_0754930 [Trichomonas vaginalis G3]EAY06004.1 hypothetical protein TVAG_053280 [Trichomonas vaginalis G3]KAI5512793.1 hypothetical protein TVAGG3_0754930 [Trichomonas vaginalis G3]|eukprot:XP_001318227.1 hypothetical protein [Trichomonas vaginalis G3]